MDIAKVLLIYLCIAIAVSLFFPQTILQGEDNNLLRVFKVYYNESTDSIQIYSGFADDDLQTLVFDDEDKPGFFQSILGSASDFFQSFVDGLRNVLGVIKILFKFLFSPFIFIMTPELMGSAPIYVKMIFALPLVLLALVGLIKFIRGVN